MMKILSPVFVFFFALSSFAADLNADYEALRNNGEKYQVIGTVCEQVAMLRMKEKYPSPQYAVYTGIEYFSEKRTIGELDVTVLDNAAGTSKAVVVAEVKCWKNLDSARVKALDQRKRFQKWIASDRPVQIKLRGEKPVSFTRDQFKQVNSYLAISQSGGQSSGFEMTLDYTLEELMALRTKILECRSRGECEPSGK